MFTAADDARAGIPVTRSPYPDGEPGIRMSLEMMGQKLREGAPTAVMKSYAGNVLKAAGFPRGARERATAILAHMHKNVGYAQDAPGTEQIQSAAITLCVEGAPVCIPIGDCDDGALACATLCAAAGLEVEFVRQFFGSELQQHVICEVRLENGAWFPLDPSHPAMKAGQKAQSTSETRHNPWAGFSHAELVGIGATPPVWMPAGYVPPPIRRVDIDVRPVGRAPETGLLADLVAQTTMPQLSPAALFASAAAIVLGATAVAAVVRQLKKERR